MDDCPGNHPIAPGSRSQRMRIPRPLHTWEVSPKEAIAIQKEVALLVTHAKPQKKLRFAAGVDAAFSKDGELCIAGVVLWDLQTREVVEQHVATAKLRLPYIPGLLTFREAPAIIAALRKLRQTPDILICDGQGIAHPRRLGIASHLSRLIGDYEEPGPKKGSKSPLLDKDTVIGTVLRTRDNVKPVFVSIGHKIDLLSAEKLILDCTAGYRLPEPTRLADHLVAKAKRDLAERKQAP